SGAARATARARRRARRHPATQLRTSQPRALTPVRTPGLYLDRRRAKTRRVPQLGRLVGALPGQVVVLAAEVAVRCRLLVDRPVQAQVPTDRARPKVEVL